MGKQVKSIKTCLDREISYVDIKNMTWEKLFVCGVITADVMHTQFGIITLWERGGWILQEKKSGLWCMYDTGSQGKKSFKSPR